MKVLEKLINCLRAWIVLLLAYAFTPLAAQAQASGNSYCHNVATTANNCFGTQEAAEDAMKALLPESYRDVIQPKSPVPSGNQPNSQGLEQWKIDYFIPDQSPVKSLPTYSVSGWNSTSNGICSGRLQSPRATPCQKK